MSLQLPIAYSAQTLLKGNGNYGNKASVGPQGHLAIWASEGLAYEDRCLDGSGGVLPPWVSLDLPFGLSMRVR